MRVFPGRHPRVLGERTRAGEGWGTRQGRRPRARCVRGQSKEAAPQQEVCNEDRGSNASSRSSVGQECPEEKESYSSSRFQGRTAILRRAFDGKGRNKREGKAVEARGGSRSSGPCAQVPPRRDREGDTQGGKSCIWRCSGDHTVRRQWGFGGEGGKMVGRQRKEES